MQTQLQRSIKIPKIALENFKVSSERLQLDEILKLLFSSSPKAMIPLINELFKEGYNPDKATISVGNSEFIKANHDTAILSVIRADLILLVTENGKTKTYLIEFQLSKDSEMVIRMFDYGFQKAKELRKPGEWVIELPKPLVIYFEKNSTIEDFLKLKVIFPDGDVKIYEVPVLKYWELSKEDILNRKMYPLLPLQLFNKRLEMELAAKHRNSPKLRELGRDALRIAEELHEDAKALNEKEDIFFGDFDKLVLSSNHQIPTTPHQRTA